MKKIVFLSFMFCFTVPIFAQSDAMLGEVRMFAGTFAPRGWAFCDGQLLPIAQNSALFSILGTTYGGDGRTTFALPDLRGRAPIHAGSGPGLITKRLGQKGGEENVTLNTLQIPAHNHAATMTLNADSTVATSDKPQGMFPARNAAATPQYGDTSNTTLAAGSVSVANTGGNQSHNNMQPYTTINFIIATQGFFPSRP